MQQAAWSVNPDAPLQHVTTCMLQHIREHAAGDEAASVQQGLLAGSYLLHVAGHQMVGGRPSGSSLASTGSNPEPAAAAEAGPSDPPAAATASTTDDNDGDARAHAQAVLLQWMQAQPSLGAWLCQLLHEHDNKKCMDKFVEKTGPEGILQGLLAVEGQLVKNGGPATYMEGNQEKQRTVGGMFIRGMKEFIKGSKGSSLRDKTNGNSTNIDDAESGSTHLGGAPPPPLKNYQLRAVEAALKANIMVVAPTGSGKTRIAVELARCGCMDQAHTQ